MQNFVPELNVTITHPDWYSLTLLKRVELSDSQIETLLKNEAATRNRQSVLRYFRARLTKYAPDVASAAPAGPDSGLESVPAVESDTQPRG